MASVGHALVGLTAAGLAPRRFARLRYAFLLPGIMVLLAYAVDLTEWFGGLVASGDLDSRFVSHSPAWVLAIVVTASAGVGVLCRIRHPWPYVLIAAVVVSHLLLDHPAVRFHLANWYWGGKHHDQPPDRAIPIVAEMCLYGLPFVWVFLAVGTTRPGCSRPARLASGTLALLCLAAAVTRLSFVWIPLYGVSVLHGVILLRRDLSVKLLWNLLPLAPVCAMALSAGLAVHQFRTGCSLAKAGRHIEAIAAYRSALEMPSKGIKAQLRMRIGISYEKLGDLAESERAYQQASATEKYGGGWPDLLLARLYVRHADTPWYQPEQAVRLYEQLIEAEGTAGSVKTRAHRELATLGEPQTGRMERMRSPK